MFAEATAGKESKTLKQTCIQELNSSFMGILQDETDALNKQLEEVEARKRAEQQVRQMFNIVLIYLILFC